VVGIIQRTGVQVGLLIAAVLIVYSASLQNAYVWLDDTNYTIYNPLVTNFSAEDTAALFRSVRGNFTPLTWLSHILAFRLFGETPFGHHLVNLLLHLINVVLCYAVLRKLATLGLSEPFDSGTSLVPFGAALLFATHPQNVEAVAWIAARKDVLMCCFALGTTVAYLRFVAGGDRGGYSGALLLFAAAILAKPTAVMLLPMLVLLDISIPRQGKRRNRSYSAALGRALPFILMACVVVWWAWAAQVAAGAIAPPGQFTLSERAVIILQNIWGYVSRYFLLGDYFVNYEVLKEVTWQVLASLAMLVIVAGSLLVPRARPWGLLWIVSLIMLAPGLGFVQYGVQAGADRFAYAAFIPLHIWVVGMVWAGYQRLQNPRQQTLFRAMVVALLLLTAGRAFLQTLVWRNDLSLWAHAATVAPENPLAWQYLGFAFMRHGDYPRAAESLAQSLEQLGEGGFVDVRALYFGLGVTSYETGKRGAAQDWLSRLQQEGMEGFDKAAYAYYYLARLAFDAQEFRSARDYLQASLALLPDYSRALELRDEIDAMAGVPGPGN
jgi:tetratricopeptide (TPR) repeat protein